MSILAAKQWGLSLPQKQLVAPLSWELHKGEVLGIIGESGSGKTVLSKALLGELPEGSIIQGKLLWQQQDMQNFNAKTWQQIRGVKISYMAQNPMAVFNSFQTIESHGIEFMKSHGLTNTQEMRKKFIASMKACNLDNAEELLRRYPFELSGGMLQRVMMGILLTMDMEVLVCDEPTSALDSFNTNIVIDCLRQVKSKGVTMVIVTHDYSLMEALADKILILQKGHCLEYGDAQTILKNPASEYGKRLLQKPNHTRYTKEAFAKNPILGGEA